MSDKHLVDRLIRHWIAEGISFNEGASPEAIVRYESANNLTLPPEFRYYLSKVNGMVNRTESDSKEFCFWPLELMQRADKFCECACSNGLVLKDLLVFCDHFICLVVYAISMDLSSDVHPVHGIQSYPDGTSTFLYSQSFDEFIVRYLEGCVL